MLFLYIFINDDRFQMLLTLSVQYRWSEFNGFVVTITVVTTRYNDEQYKPYDGATLYDRSQTAKYSEFRLLSSVVNKTHH